MLRRLLPILCTSAILPLAGCRAPQTAHVVPSTPTVALESESLIPRQSDARPVWHEEAEQQSDRGRTPSVAQAERRNVGTGSGEPIGSSKQKEAVIALAAADGEQPGSFQLAAAQPPMAPPADGEQDRGFSAAPSVSMTLGQFENLALASNPSIHQASAIANKARGTQLQVGLCPNPTVGYMGEEIGDNGTYGQQGVMASQTIVTGDKLGWNRRVAEQEVQSLLWQVETQRRRVLTDVRRQFYETLGAQERVALLAELEPIAADAAEKANILVENAQGARPDLLQAETQLNEIVLLRRQAEFEHLASWRQLANLSGQPGLAPARLDGALDAPEAERNWELSLQQVISGNPLLMQAYAEAQRARVAIERAEVQPIPNVQIQTAVMQMAESDNVAANLQIGLPLPLFNKNQGNIDRAWCEYHRAQWNAERLRLSTETQLAAAFGNYSDAVNRVAIYRDEIVPRQQESLELIELGYPAQFDFLRLFTARRSYYDARIELLNALVDLRQAEALIDGLLLTGAFNDARDTVIDDDLRGEALSGQ